MRGRSGWASAKTTLSSFIRCVPSSRRQPRPVTSAERQAVRQVAEFTSIPASAAAMGLPPAATIPMNRNSDAPASTSTLWAAGTQSGNPEATAMAP